MYNYSYHKTAEAAWAAIEEYFSTAEISECDDPRVVKVGPRRWAVQLRDNLYCY